MRQRKMLWRALACLFAIYCHLVNASILFFGVDPDDRGPWTHGKASCESLGGNLAIAGNGHDGSEMFQVLSNTGGYGGFFGLVLVNGEYRWFDGTAVTDTSALPSSNERRMCIIAWGHTGALSYSLYDCETVGGYICDDSGPMITTPAFTYFASVSNFDDAEQACQDNSVIGVLVEDDSSVKHLLITNYLVIERNVNVDVWLGMSNQDSSWEWSVAGTVTTDHWASNQPDETQRPACAILNEAENYQWSDETCTNVHSVLCEPDPRVSILFFGVDAADRGPWTHGKAACESLGGNLAIAGNGHDGSEMFQVLYNVGSYGGFFGLVLVNGEYRWLDGTAVTDTSALPVSNERRMCVVAWGNTGALTYSLHDCEIQAGYICDVSGPMVATPAFTYFASVLSYDDAEQVCQDNSVIGVLVEDDSSVKHRLITNYLVIERNVNVDVWLGLRNQDSSWEWPVAGTVTTDHWASNQPDETQRPACAILNEAEDYQWSDETCTNVHSVLCEPDPRVSILFFGVDPADRGPWTHGKAACESLGGNLAIAGNGHDGSEMFQVLYNVGGYGGFFGLVLVNGEYRWLDGTAVTDTSALPVSTERRKCVVAWGHTGALTYSLFDCEAQAGYICDVSGPMVTTPAFMYFAPAEDYADAEQVCHDNSGPLVQDDSSVKHRLITNYLVIEINIALDVWLGMLNHDSTWAWRHGGTVTTDYWASNQPDETQRPACAILNEAENYQWSDETCTNAYSVLCEPWGLYLIENNLPPA